MPIHCLIIDDEPLAREVLESFVGEIPDLVLESSCANARTALEVLKETDIDVIFLDIQMPGMSGIHFLKSLAKPPKVIFTTAYPEYAVEGFELEATDYLLKPFSFDRFQKALSRVRLQLEKPTEVNNPGFWMVKADKKLYKVDWGDVQYIQSIGDYLKVFTKERVLVTKETLKKVEQKLPSSFIRIHKSYVCPVSAIQYIEGNQVYVGETALPIGNTYKQELIRRLEQE